MVDYKALSKELYDFIQGKGCHPIMIRLAWHDAGTYDKESHTGGPRGTIRHFPESSYSANAGLQIARDFLEPFKQKYPEITYADLYSLAGVVALIATGGPRVPYRPGRKDDPAEKCSPNGRLPDGDKDQNHLRHIFYRMGFNDQDIVALSGAHTLGRCHPDRSGFNGPWTEHPLSWDNEYFKLLINDHWTLDGNQYKNDKGNLMMLPTDMALINDPAMKVFVEKYANSLEEFNRDFVQAFQKLIELGWESKLQDPVELI
jgi:cytochrome c peroxidase